MQKLTIVPFSTTFASIPNKLEMIFVKPEQNVFNLALVLLLTMIIKIYFKCPWEIFISRFGKEGIRSCEVCALKTKREEFLKREIVIYLEKTSRE